MEEKFMKILASVSDYNECNFRVGGRCRATSIGECSKKCKFFTVPISKYKEKTVKVYESKQEEVNKLQEEVNKLQEKIKVLEKENCELKKQLESWQEEYEDNQDHKRNDHVPG